MWAYSLPRAHLGHGQRQPYYTPLVLRTPHGASLIDEFPAPTFKVGAVGEFFSVIVGYGQRFIFGVNMRDLSFVPCLH